MGVDSYAAVPLQVPEFYRRTAGLHLEMPVKTGQVAEPVVKGCVDDLAAMTIKKNL